MHLLFFIGMITLFRLRAFIALQWNHYIVLAQSICCSSIESSRCSGSTLQCTCAVCPFVEVLALGLQLECIRFPALKLSRWSFRFSQIARLGWTSCMHCRATMPFHIFLRILAYVCDLSMCWRFSSWKSCIGSTDPLHLFPMLLKHFPSSKS